MSGDAVRGPVPDDSSPIDFGATDAGVVFLAAVDAIADEADRPFVARAVERALLEARAVPVSAAGVAWRRVQARTVLDHLDRIEAAEAKLEEAAELLQIEDKQLLRKLVLVGLGEVFENDAYWAEPTRIDDADPKSLHDRAADLARAQHLDVNEPAGYAWMKQYTPAIITARNDRPSGGGARQPSPAGIITRMMWQAMGEALREPTDTWSPTVGIARLLGAYTRHRLTPKRVRKVVDAMRPHDRRGSISGDYRMHLYPVR